MMYGANNIIAFPKPTEAQTFVDASLKLMQQGFKLRDAPAPVRPVLELFPPQHRLTLLKTWVAWTLRTCSPAYQKLPASTFLLAVPIRRGCWVATFDTTRLQATPPEVFGADALALHLLEQFGNPDQPMVDTLLRSIARAVVDAPPVAIPLDRLSVMAWPAIVFAGAISASRNQPRRHGAVVVPVGEHGPMRDIIKSEAVLANYVRAIYAGLGVAGC
jgi:hypothetical protein